MGDKIKTAIEIAMEKAALLDDLSPEEKEALIDKKKLEPTMVKFYRMEIGPDELWKKLKGENAALLCQAQLNLTDSLKFGMPASEIQRRKKGILALETLKPEKKTTIIEQGLGLLETLQKKAEEEKKQVYDQFKKAIEKNPQARVRMVEQGDAKIVTKISLEEAITQNPQWKQFILEFTNNYQKEFERIISQIKAQIIGS
jgi:hypothetical protein